MAAQARDWLRRDAGNTGWLLLERGLRLGGGLLISAWMARALGPAAFGSYALAVALTLIVAALAGAGLEQVVVRELVRRPAEAPAILGSGLALRLGGGLAAAGLAVAAAAALRPADPELALLTGLLGLGAMLQGLAGADLWFQARSDMAGAVLPRVAALLAGLALRAGLLLAGAPLIAFGWALLAEGALTAAALLAAGAARGARPLAWRPAPAWLAALLRDGWPLVASGLLINLYLRIDQLMLAQMLGDGALGLYGAAVRLAEALPILPSLIATATFPGLVALREADPAGFADRLGRLYAVVAALGYGLALPLSLLAGPLTWLLYGPAYAGAGPILAVLAWAGLFSALGVVRTAYLMAEGLGRLFLLTVLIGFVANLGLNWLLIPRLGGLGAALAALAAQVIASYGSCFLFPRLWPAGLALTRALLWPKFW